MSTAAIPIVTKLGSSLSNFASSPGGALTLGFLFTINPINLLNWLLLLIFSLIIYYWNPPLLRNARDETTGQTYVTFGRAFLVALVPYFIVAMLIYTLYWYSKAKVGQVVLSYL